MMVLIGLGNSAMAREIKVAPNGNDRNSGNASAPYLTINHALEHARAGDVITVAPGTYYEILRIRKSGTARKPITIRSERPFAAVIDGAGMRADTDLVQITGNHVVFRGFRVKNATRSGISAWSVSGVLIEDNHVTGSVRSGIWVGHTKPGQSRNNRIERNVVVGNCLENQRRNWSSGWPRAIAADLTDNVRIAQNVVFQNYGEGIGVLSARGAKITGNVTFDNYSVNIYLDNAPRTEVTNNLVFSAGDRRFFRNGRSGDGILIANEDTAYVYPSEGIVVKGNTLVATAPVRYDHYGRGGGLWNSDISGNTMLGKLPLHRLQDMIDAKTGHSIDLHRR